MNKQTLIVAIGLFFLGGAILWSTFSATEISAGQAIAAEADQAENKQADAPVSPWNIKCAEVMKPGTEEKIEYCQMFQRLNEQKTGKRFAEILIGYPKEAGGEARGVVILPLGVLLRPGVKMQIDSGKVYEFDFRYCTDIGCVSVIDLSANIINEMKKGNKAAIQFMSAKGMKINLPITLKGFTKAINDLPK